MTNPLQSEREALTEAEIVSIYTTWDSRPGSTHAQLIADCYALGRQRALASRAPSPAPEGAAEPTSKEEALKQALLAYDTKGTREIAPLVAAIKTYRNLTGETLVRSKEIIEKVLQDRAEVQLARALAAVPQAAEPPSKDPSGLPFVSILQEQWRLELWLVVMDNGSIRPFGSTGPVSLPSAWDAEYRAALASQKGQQK